MTIAKNSSILFLHGAGNASKTSTHYLEEALQKQGLSTFSFDFPGHGKSLEKLEESSLEKRYQAAKHAASKLKSPFGICATSMSGTTAIQLLKDFPDIQSLILFAPALYDKAAYTIPFGEGFSEIIRQEKSWRNSEELSLLQNYKGKLLIFVGENDPVIPKEVIELLDLNSTESGQKAVFVLPNCKHNIHRWAQKSPENMSFIMEKISSFL